jgi:hypothetical protein
MPGGFYLMNRGWLDHPVLAGEFDRRSAWSWLIENAAWKPRSVSVKGKIIALERGQLVASVRYLSVAWGWRRDKTHRFVGSLRTATMIRTENRTGETVITICNYDVYQYDVEFGRTVNRTENRTAVGQNK